MKTRVMKTGLGLMAFALVLGLSGCGRSKQAAALALDEARLMISSAKSAGAQTFAADTLKSAETFLEAADKAFGAQHYSPAKVDAEKAVQLAKAALGEAEKKAADKKLKAAKKKVTAAVKAVKPVKNSK